MLPALQLLMPYAGAAVAQLMEGPNAEVQASVHSRAAFTAQMQDEALMSGNDLSSNSAVDCLRDGRQGAAGVYGEEETGAGKVGCTTPRQRPLAELGATRSLRSRVSQQVAHPSATAQTDTSQFDPARRRHLDGGQQRGGRRRHNLATAAVMLCLGAQLPAAAYFCLVHQR